MGVKLLAFCFLLKTAKGFRAGKAQEKKTRRNNEQKKRGKEGKRERRFFANKRPFSHPPRNVFFSTYLDISLCLLFINRKSNVSSIRAYIVLTKKGKKDEDGKRAPQQRETKKNQTLSPTFFPHFSSASLSTRKNLPLQAVSQVHVSIRTTAAAAQGRPTRARAATVSGEEARGEADAEDDPEEEETASAAATTPAAAAAAPAATARALSSRASAARHTEQCLVCLSHRSSTAGAVGGTPFGSGLREDKAATEEAPRSSPQGPPPPCLSTQSWKALTPTSACVASQ